MRRKNPTLSDLRREYLECSHCGNSDYFVEYLAHGSNIVNGDLIYIRLVESATDEYRCCRCGESVEVRCVEMST